MRTFVMGDIHGCYRGLIQCLERSGFNKEEDRLIQLGDVADGWSEVYECVEELLSIPNLIAIKGNHDDEFLFWMEHGYHKWHWLQGAYATLKSYIKHADREVKHIPSNGGYKTDLTSWDIKPEHQKFFKDQVYAHIENNKCFVHGGFNRHVEFAGQTPSNIYWWDRDLWMAALSYQSMIKNAKNGYDGKFHMKTPFDEVYIGHTATDMWGSTEPIQAANVINLDTGAGWTGKLTIMHIETKEYWQSDLVAELYPEEKGRRG